MSVRAPSTALLRALLPSSTTASPLSSHCLRQQSRAKSMWMPAKKYKKITGLDKLHRRQREARIQERIDSQTRASSMVYNPPAPIIISTTNPLDPQSPPPSLAESASTPTPTATETTPDKLPYLITRTPSSHLPVYEHTKGGGTKHITVLRKLSGDLDALQHHLRDALGLAQGFIDAKGRKKEYVVVNQTTKQVVIRGWRGAEVKRWCELAGF